MEKSSEKKEFKSLYPEGVDPNLVDETHNARGQWSPYSEKQRKAASVLIREYQANGMTLLEATNEAFKAVGEPENMDEVTQGKQKKINN
jgi:hypothetical protein